MVKMEPEASDLGEYLKQVMEERRLSQRALAMYVGVSNSTISRIIKGDDADPETLNKIADYLNIPPEILYRLAGYLPEDELKSEMIDHIEHLVGQLPEDDQRKVLEMIKVMVRLYEDSNKDQ